MKKTLLSFVAMIFTFVAVAQERTGQYTWMEHPDVVIKGDELKNFPGGQLSEMLIGRLPGIDHINTMDQEFKVVFIVDGFVWKSIDAININNIEEIAYYRGGLNAMLGIQNENPNGVVVITTKTAEFKQPFSVDVNTMLGGNFYKEDLVNKKHRVFQSYNVVLSQGLDKFSWRASAVYNNATRNLTGFDFTRQFQLNGDLRFSPLKWLDLGLNLNYAPGKGDFEFSNDPRGTGDAIVKTETKLELDNWNGTFYMRIKPIKGLVNEVSALKSRIASDQDLYASTYYINPVYGPGGYSRSLNDLKYNSLFFQNDLSYRFSVNEDKIKLKAGAIFQYNDLKANEAIKTERGVLDDLGNPLPAGAFYGSTMGLASKYFTFAGDLSINFYDILSLQAGVRSDKAKGSTTKAINAPFYYGDLNLKQALLKDMEAVNEVRLFGSYGEYRSTMVLQSMQSFGMYLQDYQFVNFNFNSNDDKMKAQNFGLKTMFFDRVRLSADLYKNSNYVVMRIFIPNYQDSRFVSPIDYSGWRIWGSTDILKRSALKWNAGLNVFKNKAKLRSTSNTQMTVNEELNKTAIQAGMQHNFAYGNFSLSLNGSAYFNHPVFESALVGNQLNRSIEQSTFVNLNYLSMSYNFKDQVAGKKIKDLNISLVARNLVQKKEHVLDNVLSKTIGVALNASF